MSRRTAAVLLFTQSQVNKWVHAFLKSISRKVNAMARLEFELGYYDVAAQHVNHYTITKTPRLFCVSTYWAYIYAEKYISIYIRAPWLVH